jgi:hypothetical protein
MDLMDCDNISQATVLIEPGSLMDRRSAFLVICRLDQKVARKHQNRRTVTSWEHGVSLVAVLSVRLVEGCNLFEEDRTVISCCDLHVPKIIVGVDTHKDEHVAVVIDKLGSRIGQRNLLKTNSGYVSLEHWASGLGEIEAFGVEGTGSYGAGLTRFLRGQ